MIVRRRPLTSVLGLGLAAAFLGLLAYGLVLQAPNTTLDDAVQRGERPAAPGTSRDLPRLEGPGTRSLDDYRGKVVVLNFWASWCAPCEVEAPALQRIHEQLVATGRGTVLAASYQDAITDSKRFVRRLDLSFPVVRDVDMELAAEYGTRNLPETFVIDPQGRVVAISRGQTDDRFLRDAVRRAGGVA